MHCNTYYHVYNHANGTENLFKEEANYYFFIDKIKKYLYPVCRIYAYCLMPNHFHLLIKTNSEDDLELLPKSEKYDQIEFFVIKQFSNCFNSYTQSFNKKYNRRGSLFIKSFNYKPILTESYLQHIVAYIHGNPIKHGFCEDFDKWKFSSYLDIIAKDILLVKPDDATQIFGSKKLFQQFHDLHLSSIKVFEGINID